MPNDVGSVSVEDLASIRARLAQLHRGAGDRPMSTRQQCAAIEFEPLGPEICEPFLNPGWDRECHELGVVLRMAAAVVQKTKPELIAIVEALVSAADPAAADGFFELLTSYREFKERLDLWGRLLDVAEVRQLIAASALSLGDDGGGGEPAAVAA